MQPLWLVLWFGRLISIPPSRTPSTPYVGSAWAPPTGGPWFSAAASRAPTETPTTLSRAPTTVPTFVSLPTLVTASPSSPPTQPATALPTAPPSELPAVAWQLPVWYDSGNPLSATYVLAHSMRQSDTSRHLCALQACTELVASWCTLDGPAGCPCDLRPPPTDLRN